MGKQRSWGSSEKEELLQNITSETFQPPCNTGVTTSGNMSSDELVTSSDEQFHTQKK